MMTKTQEWQALQFGMFIHFGLYSVPAGVWNGQKVEVGYSEQIFHHGHIPKADYEAIASAFNPVKFDANGIARLAKAAGMTYILITTKHHDGFSLFHTKQSKFNVVDATPYGKDIVKELSDACARNGLKFGVYFSWIDWHCPYALPMTLHNSDLIPPKHMAFNLAQVEELMSNYGPIAEVWFDMGAPTLEQSREMAALVHRLQPRAMINGRIWNDQSDFAVLGDNEVPTYAIAGPWQTPASIYHSTWGYRSWQVRENLPGKIAELTGHMRKVFELGGNYLLNIGPRGDGSVVEFEADVLRGIGQWMRSTQAVTSSHSERPVYDCPGTLRDEDAVSYHHFTGREYGDCKAVVIEKRWLVRPRNAGTYELTVAFRNDHLAGRTLTVTVNGTRREVTAPSIGSTVTAGTLKLQGGGTYELALTLQRGAAFAEHPQPLTGANVVLS